MNYRDAHFIHLRFPDGTIDLGEHPYVCVLDQNSSAKSYHLLKGKTYDPIKHLKYVRQGTDKVIHLYRPTLVNLKEPQKLEFSDESVVNPRFIKQVHPNEFIDVTTQYYDFNISSCTRPKIFERDKEILKKYLHK